MIEEAKITQQGRRTQVERLASTRKLILAATVVALNKFGYNGATAAMIADQAGVSRGAINYHFESRAQLMAEVLSSVIDLEQAKYRELESQGFSRSTVADWPEMLWQVASTPSGMAVIEILLAGRSDQQLSELVKPTVTELEINACIRISKIFPAIEMKQLKAALRLFVWAIRGLAIAKDLSTKPDEINESVKIFSELVRRALQSDPTLKHDPFA